MDLRERWHPGASSTLLDEINRPSKGDKQLLHLRREAVIVKPWNFVEEVARNSMDHTTPITFPEDETFDIGEDTRTGVALLEYRYDVPFKFTGKINRLTFNLAPEQ
jgi:hypothetical protein